MRENTHTIEGRNEHIPKYTMYEFAQDTCHQSNRTVAALGRSPGGIYLIEKRQAVGRGDSGVGFIPRAASSDVHVFFSLGGIMCRLAQQ